MSNFWGSVQNGTSSTTLNVSFYYASKEVKPNGSLTGLRSDIGSIPEGSISVLVTLGSGTNSLLTALPKLNIFLRALVLLKS